MAKKSEKGIALIITFFILTIILAVVLSISVLLYGEVKIIRNIGNSVAAFYMADSGVEKFLYYDRKGAAFEGGRGICNICEVCPDCDGGGINCSVTPAIDGGCDFETCAYCNVVFATPVGTDYYKVDVNIEQQCQVSEGTANSYGVYKNVSRAVQLDITRIVNNPSGPNITNEKAVFKALQSKLTISANISDPDGPGDIQSVTAYIKRPDLPEWPTVELILELDEGDKYSKPWTQAVQGVDYLISIVVYDASNNCASISGVDITYE